MTSEWDSAAAIRRRIWEPVSAEVARVVAGSHDAALQLAVALLAGGHVLVEDVPGVGKTLLARSFAAALGLSFRRIQGTPDLLPSDVTGSSLPEDGRLRFVPGPIFVNVVLVDEINRATPRTQSALLEAMQEAQVSADGQTHRLPEPFFVLATQNPIELEGTFALPEAQLDRFLLRVTIGYPDEAEERQIITQYQAAAEPVAQVSAAVDPGDIARARDAVRTIRVSREVESYLLALVRGTRTRPELRLGASPRAAVSLYRASQALAALSGRDFVLPDDVQAMALPVLAHRLQVDVDHELRGVGADDVLAELLGGVEVPLGEG